MPRVRAASASAAPWLPEECVTTPRGGLVRGQRPHRIAGAAELERADALQVLGLEGDATAGERVQRARAQHRRDVRMRRDARGGGQDVGKGGQ